MAKSRGLVLLICALAVLLGSATIVITAPIDNVAVQGNLLLNELICSAGVTVPVVEPNILLVQLHLAQWHALLALKDTGSCTTQEAVVAFASHKVVTNYFPFSQDFVIDPLLESQLTVLRLSASQERLGKRLGEAVALNLISKRSTSREFSVEAVKAALDARQNHLTPGLYRYLNDTPASRDASIFIFHNIAVEKPFVVPNPIDFIAEYLSEVKPPTVPSDAWDFEYNFVKDIGRADWPGRTFQMNLTAALYPCRLLNSTYCNPDTLWHDIARASLPADTSLSDTVTLFAKLSVALHDALVVLTTLQFGFWFWRPEMAFKAGDPRHAPIPTWTPFLPTPLHAEFPSGTVTTISAGATVMQTFFGDQVVPFTIEGGTFAPSCSPLAGVVVGPRHFSSFATVLHDAQLARMYAGAHYNTSVTYAAMVGATVAHFVERRWAKPTPSGVLPDSTYLRVFAHLPRAAGDWSPIHLEL